MKKIPFLFVLIVIAGWNFLCQAAQLSLAQSDPAGSFTPVNAMNNYYVDPYTGSANFSLPLALPSLRESIPFSPKLVYSSRANNGWLGVGWKLDLGVIERSTKNGFPSYDSNDEFVFSFGDQQNELVKINSTEYRAKHSSADWQFLFNGEHWMVKDPLGRTYYFGLEDVFSDYSRTKDPQNPQKVFRWRLSKIVDNTGNALCITYLRDCIEIFYAEKSEASRASSRKDDYNYWTRIYFTNDRSDIVFSFRPGFIDDYPFAGRGRISRIHYHYQRQLIKQLVFEYESSPLTARSLLVRISERGNDGVTRNPPITFRYDASQPSYDTLAYTLLNRHILVRHDGRWNIRYAEHTELPTGEYSLTSDGFVNQDNIIFPVDWSTTKAEETGDESGFSWQITDRNVISWHSNLHLQGKKGQLFHIWTYLVMSFPYDEVVNLNIPFQDNCNAHYYYSDQRGRHGPFPLSTPLNLATLKGDWTKYIFRIDIFGYNFESDFSMNYQIGNTLGFWQALSSKARFFPDTILSEGFVWRGPNVAGDFNGGGKTDLGFYVRAINPSMNSSTTESFEVLVPFSNNDDEFYTPSNFLRYRTLPTPSNRRVHDIVLGDFNGDGKTDLALLEEDSRRIKLALSTGLRFQEQSDCSEEIPYTHPLAGDFNGDGLTDIAFLDLRNRSLPKIIIAWNRNARFQLDEGFTPEGISWRILEALTIGDYNGDGISEFAVWEQDERSIILFAPQNAWKRSITIPPQTSYYRLFSSDFNADNKADYLYYNSAQASVMYRNILTDLNTVSHNLNLSFSSIASLEHLPFQIGDFNGDSFTDFLLDQDSLGFEAAFSKAKNATDFLISIENGLGATLAFEYRPSSAYNNLQDDGTHGLPFVVPVISKVTLSDGISPPYVSNYVYAKGYFSPTQKEFRGFGYTLFMDNEKATTETYFLQDDIYKGRIQQQKIRDKDGRLMAETRNTWDHRTPYPGTFQVLLRQTDEYTYYEDGTSTQTQTTFAYDSYGNPILKKEWGDVGISGDEREEITEYSHNRADWLINYPSRRYLRAPDGTISQEEWFYYDDAQDFNTAPTQGLLTKTEIALYNPLSRTTQRAFQRYSYDEFGNLRTVTDPLGRITATEYDEQTHLYPARTTNALG
ncbi:MAG: VCBS repeat-containing protein, partial [Candidatus Omnitrophica bacterium]|nr:VCBS repeat-containing protein [Candidatus Omnitrophota bacterium]